jgi:hypothetical protein
VGQAKTRKKNDPEYGKKSNVIQMPSRKEEDHPPTQDEQFIHYGAMKKDGKFVISRHGCPSTDESYDAAADKFEADREGSEYANLFRMYPNGKVNPAFEIKAKSEDDDKDPSLLAFNSAQREAQSLVEAAYDQEFPEIGAKVQKFISESVSYILAFDFPKQADGSFDDESLLDILRQEEGEFLAKGSINPKLGWEIAPGEAIFVTAALPVEGKYRYARAVSEIAQITNAKAIIQIGETWCRAVETGKRDGREGLLAIRVLPDASVTSEASSTYIRVNGRLQVIEPIHALDTNKFRPEQRLFPAWRIAGTTSAQTSTAVN